MQTYIHELFIFQILVLFCRLGIGRILDPLLGLCGRQRQRYVVLRGGGISSTQTSWTVLLKHRYKPMSTSSCSICKFWFITYSLNMLYFCRSSGYRTPATFLNTSSSHPCVTETDFCGGQRCHSSSTMVRVAFSKQGATPVWEGSAFASRACVHRSSLAQVRNQLDAFFIILIWHKLVCK
jgi:hypothetical protein